MLAVDGLAVMMIVGAGMRTVHRHELWVVLCGGIRRMPVLPMQPDTIAPARVCMCC